MQTSTLSSTQFGERIELLDSLRGFAVLGILMMNIPGFGLPHIAVDDLRLLNETQGINFQTWFWVELIPEGTQRALFSMLFGAGMLLFISRLEKRTEGLIPADLYVRRQLWLIVFGLFNTYILLWFWDILFAYGIAGLILFAFRRLSVRYLLLAAAICFVLADFSEMHYLYKNKRIVASGETIQKIDTSLQKLSAAQIADLSKYEEFLEETSLESRRKEMQEQIRLTSGPYSGLYELHSAKGYSSHTDFLYNVGIWDILLFMFLGMAFYRSGILLGQASMRTYWLLFLIGSAVGLFFSYHRLNLNIATHFDELSYAKINSYQYYELSRLPRSIGLLGLLMLLYRSGLFNWLFRLLQPVGQMAFTNYLMQLIVCGLIFYGIGAGLFGKLQRYELYFVVLGVWIFQVLFSHLWLRWFLYGPFEWAWRSLTYWKAQSFLRSIERGSI